MRARRLTPGAALRFIWHHMLCREDTAENHEASKHRSGGWVEQAQAWVHTAYDYGLGPRSSPDAQDCTLYSIPAPSRQSQRIASRLQGHFVAKDCLSTGPDRAGEAGSLQGEPSSEPRKRNVEPPPFRTPGGLGRGSYGLPGLREGQPLGAGIHDNDVARGELAGKNRPG